MRYQDINELDARIEKIIKKKVENYYTDWKNYDRPKYMKYKGSSDRSDKTLVLIARTCGTELLKASDIYKKDWATTLFEYYQCKCEKGNDYYLIDLDRLEVKKIDAETYGKDLKKAA